jgi:IS5 family transposase
MPNLSQNLADLAQIITAMLGKSPNQKNPQMNLFRPVLKSFINMDDKLVLLGNSLNWNGLENHLSPLYATTGTPSKPVRMMAGLLLLKQMFDHSDDEVIAAWIQNPYYQYFTGETVFHWEQPCAASDLAHFRKRIGHDGVNKILSMSVELFASEVKAAKTVLVDTTVQEKNITFPTDLKLALKIISGCRKIARKYALTLRQTYTRTVKKLLIINRFSRNPAKQKQARKAQKKIKVIAGRLVRDLERKIEATTTTAIPAEVATLLARYTKVLAQKRTDKNKIYSLHEPDVACIAKGKAGIPYEFGSKVAVLSLPGSNIVVGIVNFTGNPNDSTTLDQSLAAAKAITGREFDQAVTDRGYQGNVQIGKTKIILPNPKKDSTLPPARKAQKRKLCRSRAAIEPVISHLKHDHRMQRNFLKGVIGDHINAAMAGAAFNCRKYMRQLLACLLRWMALANMFLSQNPMPAPLPGKVAYTALSGPLRRGCC